MKDIKRRRPKWRFQFCSNSWKNSDRKFKKSKGNRKYFSNINKLKNFLIINQILSQIKIEGSYEENAHLFEALKGTRRKGQNSTSKWLIFHKIPELPDL